jgi:hypothetical protein
MESADEVERLVASRETPFIEIELSPDAARRNQSATVKLAARHITSIESAWWNPSKK